MLAYSKSLANMFYEIITTYIAPCSLCSLLREMQHKSVRGNRNEKSKVRDGNTAVPLSLACPAQQPESTENQQPSDEAAYSCKRNPMCICSICWRPFPLPGLNGNLSGVKQSMICIPWVSGMSQNHLTAERPSHCTGSSKGQAFLIISAGFSYHWAGAGIAYQQMFILSSLTSPPWCSNPVWGSLCLFNSSQIRTTARKEHQFAEVCDSAREITPRTPTVLSSDFEIIVARLILDTKLLIAE